MRVRNALKLFFLLPLSVFFALAQLSVAAEGDARFTLQRESAEEEPIGAGAMEYRAVQEQLPKIDLNTDAKEWGKSEGVEAAWKKSIKLLAEAGDGEVALHWYLADPVSTRDGRSGAEAEAKTTVKTGAVSGEEVPLRQKVVRYAVYRRMEGENTGHVVDVLKGANYRLRKLKNNRVYLVQVKGFAADGKEVASSEELAVTPMSVDELASSIERAFATELTTLHSELQGEERAGGAPEKAAPFRRQLTQFGYDFFKNSGDNFLSTNLPVGPEYVLGPGDALRVDLWGSLQARHELVVDRSGTISIPRVGAVRVWGLAYPEAVEAIRNAVSRYFRSFEMNVSLGKLRTIQVYVVGEVRAPGAYTVSSLATALNALSAAGGPTKNGTLRTVRLTRGGKTVQEMDFYDMFLTGDRSKDARLENGDTLFVPVIGPVAAVAGEVKRPAIYELKGDSSLADLIALAGGATAAADSSRIQVERVEGGSRVVVDHGAGGAELAGAPAKDRDMVKVFPVLPATRGVVTLKGNVVRSGEYQFRPGMRLRDLIPDHGSLLPESYLGSVEITRLEMPDRHRELIAADLGKALAGDPAANIELKEQDSVRVFSLWDMQEKPTVAVAGEVLKPGDYPYYPRMTVRDLVSAAGSLKRNALMNDAELTRLEVRDGTAVSTRVNMDLAKALAGDPQHNLTLQPDDTLIVRGISEWVEASDRFMVLHGEVRYPGTYSFAKGERLSSLISRAGGFTEDAYLKGARFTRTSVRENQQKRLNEVIARTELEIRKKQGELSAVASTTEELEATKSSLEGLLAGLDKLKGKKAEGRVVVTLLPPERLAGSEYDLELMGGDRLEVPPVPSEVNVMGQVYNPTAFLYREGSSVSSYLKRSGGPTRDAAADDMYIVKADGSVESRRQSSFGIRWDEGEKKWNFGGFLGRDMDPGDTLVVPQKLERTAWMRELKDITTILSQVALTAGSVFLWFK